MILRVSDLSSVLNKGKSDTGETISWETVEEAISAFHDALDVGKNASAEDKAGLSSMLLEVSYPNGDSTYKSKNIQYAFLSGDIQYDILHGNAPFDKTKDFLSGLNVSGDVNLNVNNFNLSSNVIGLSGNNISIYGRETLNLIYSGRLLIQYDPDGTKKNLITVATFSHTADNETPTVAFDETSQSNPIYGTAQHALWS